MISQKMVRNSDLKRYRSNILKFAVSLGTTIFLITFFYSFAYGQEKIIAIKGGKIQTVTKGIIEKGIILIKKDKIADVGVQILIPPQAEIFDFQDKFIMPGVVSPDSNLGIFTPTPRVTSSYFRFAEPAGKNLAFYPVIFSFYPENPDYQLALKNGFTTLALSPPPEGISGLGACVRLESKSFRECLVKERAFLKITYFVHTPFWNMLKSALEEAQRKMDELKKRKEEEKKQKEEKAKEKKAKSEPEEKEEITINESTKIFMEVIEGKLPVIAECQEPDSIPHLLQLLSPYPKVKLIIRGGPYTYKAGSLLKEKNVPIILEPKLAVKKDFSTPYAEKTNYLLKCQRLGLKISIQAPGNVDEQIHLFDMLNNLYELGVNKDTLLQGITIVPAQILEVDNLVGSLEKGKKADIIIFEDDPFENLPVLEKVILGGKFVQ